MSSKVLCAQFARQSSAVAHGKKTDINIGASLVPVFFLVCSGLVACRLVPDASVGHLLISIWQEMDPQTIFVSSFTRCSFHPISRHASTGVPIERSAAAMLQRWTIAFRSASHTPR